MIRSRWEALGAMSRGGTLLPFRSMPKVLRRRSNRSCLVPDTALPFMRSRLVISCMWSDLGSLNNLVMAVSILSSGVASGLGLGGVLELWYLLARIAKADVNILVMAMSILSPGVAS